MPVVVTPLPAGRQGLHYVKEIHVLVLVTQDNGAK